MPIARIDIMTMAPKTNEATSFKVNQNEKPVKEQIVISDHQHKNAERNSQQTIRKANTDNPAYRYDAKEKGNNAYSNQGKQKKKSSQDEKEKEKNSRSGNIEAHHLDITI